MTSETGQQQIHFVSRVQWAHTPAPLIQVPSVHFSSDLRSFNARSYSRDGKISSSLKRRVHWCLVLLCVLMQPGRAGLLTSVDSPKKETLCEPSSRALIKDVVICSMLYHNLACCTTISNDRRCKRKVRMYFW